MTDLKTALAALKMTADSSAAPSPSTQADQAPSNPKPARPRSVAVRPSQTAETPANAPSEATQDSLATKPQQERQPPRCMPTLEKLAALYPQLFGEVFLPMKRGIYQDLLAAHPTDLDKDVLKEALAFHSRSTRYLNCVASGQQRHDLTGTPVEPMAPENVYHALMEVFRRRTVRKPQPGKANMRQESPEQQRAKLISRIVGAMDASGLPRQAYAELVRGKDETANAILDEAMAQAATRNAKDEALLSTFTASGETIEAFSDVYGMNPRTVAASLDRARRTA